MEKSRKNMEEIYDRYCSYDKRKFSPINLGNSPEEVREDVYNICRFLYDGWDTSSQKTKKEFEKLVSFFENPDKILMNMVALKEQDMKNLPVQILQIAAFRFLKFHLPQIHNTLEKNDWKNSGKLWNSSSLLEQVELEEWEKPFWLVASGQNLGGYGFFAVEPFNPFMEEAPIDIEQKNEQRLFFEKISDEERRRIREKIITSAMKHKDTIEQIRQLQQKYQPYALKAEKLNYAAKQYTKEQHEEKLVAVQGMKQIIELLEKNLSGELTTSDMVETEKQLPEWKKELENLTETVNELFSCLG